MFIFKSYLYDKLSKSAHFHYQNDGIDFEERVVFEEARSQYNEQTLDRALFLAFVIIGVSYYKTFPSKHVFFERGTLDEWQAEFFNHVYQEGMSQFVFENNLTRSDLAHFGPTGESGGPAQYQVEDELPLVLQSGGKDSLLLAGLLKAGNKPFTPWYISSVKEHPALLDSFVKPVARVQRLLDHEALKKAEQKGGRNGHVPVTYVVFSIALLQAVLLGKGTILAAIGNEGEEAHDTIGDLPVQHQWAKTWRAEQDFAKYVGRYVSPEIKIGSPLRKYSELKIAELFVAKCWSEYADQFSSCNIGNYKQGQNNQKLGWCGECPKCANSFLLFAPFVEPAQLTKLFGGENLFKKELLTETFKGLLGIDDVMKPLECVGEVDELRKAYQMAQELSPGYVLPFNVPSSDFDYQKEYQAQKWALEYL